MEENKSTQFPLELIWAKSNAEGYSHSLPGHLADTIAVAGLIWDQFMASGFKERINRYCGGYGQEVYLLIAGWHDVGKATPAFQSKRKDLASDLLKQGNLSDFSSYGRDELGWHHTHAGRAILEDYLNTTCPQMNWSWLPIIIEGHHGYFKSQNNQRGRGDEGWIALQRRLCTVQSSLRESSPACGNDPNPQYGFNRCASRPRHANPCPPPRWTGWTSTRGLDCEMDDDHRDMDTGGIGYEG